MVVSSRTGPGVITEFGPTPSRPLLAFWDAKGEPKEVAELLAAGRARAERIARQWVRRPSSPEREQAIERARTALRLVNTDIESTTDLREDSAILRYGDWCQRRSTRVFEGFQDPDSWIFGGGDEDCQRS
jgi:hypothetical protein